MQHFIENLVVELNLDSEQKETLTQLFDQSKDEVLALLTTEYDEGGSLMDDFATDLADGEPYREAFQSFIGRMLSEKRPGSDQTYMNEITQINQRVSQQLTDHLDEDQLAQFKKLKVALLEVQTGYDPGREYVESRLKKD